MPPELETPRLRLRMFTPDDLDIYHERIYGDADVMQRYDPGAELKTKAYTQEMLDHFIEYWNAHPLGVWAVIEKASDEFIGYAGLLYFKGQPEVEVLYALGKAYWGRSTPEKLPSPACATDLKLLGLSAFTPSRLLKTRPPSG